MKSDGHGDQEIVGEERGAFLRPLRKDPAERVFVAVHPLLVRLFPRWMIIGAFLLLAGTWIAAFAVPNVPGAASLVTHYTTTFGIDALGSWRALVRLPLTGTVFVLLNIVLAFLLTTPRDAAPSSASLTLCVAAFLIALATLTGTVLLWSKNLA
ncbi:MAG: hypothetical protein Q7S96_05175 [bacterium]|nr:hypothetical protein [bacterium]